MSKYQTTKKRFAEVPRSIPADLQAPACLDEEGRKLWNDLAPGLASADLLTPMDVPALTMLCQTWELFQSPDITVKQKCDLQSRLNQQFKQFGLTPASRKGMAVSFREATQKEDELKL